jgi:hypothetical protein
VLSDQSFEIQLQRFREIVSRVHPGVTAGGDKAFVLDILFLQESVERDRLSVQKVLVAHAQP